MQFKATVLMSYQSSVCDVSQDIWAIRDGIIMVNVSVNVLGDGRCIICVKLAFFSPLRHVVRSWFVDQILEHVYLSVSVIDQENGADEQSNQFN